MTQQRAQVSLVPPEFKSRKLLMSADVWLHQQAEVALPNCLKYFAGHRPFSVDECLGKNWHVVDAEMLWARNFPRPCEFQMALLRINPKMPAPA